MDPLLIGWPMMGSVLIDRRSMDPLLIAGSVFIWQVFESVVRDMLVKNKHRATVESIPSTSMEAAIEGKEKGILDEIKKSMSDQVQCSKPCF